MERMIWWLLACTGGEVPTEPAPTAPSAASDSRMRLRVLANAEASARRSARLSSPCRSSDSMRFWSVLCSTIQTCSVTNV
jgi:hypothetical protein